MDITIKSDSLGLQQKSISEKELYRTVAEYICDCTAPDTVDVETSLGNIQYQLVNC